jgi:hypothetical protein
LAFTNNYDLTIYGNEVESLKFRDWINKIAGLDNSNMIKIDDVLKKHSDSISEKSEFLLINSAGELAAVEDPRNKLCFVIEDGCLYAYDIEWFPLSSNKNSANAFIDKTQRGFTAIIDDGNPDDSSVYGICMYGAVNDPSIDFDGTSTADSFRRPRISKPSAHASLRK